MALEPRRAVLSDAAVSSPPRRERRARREMRLPPIGWAALQVLLQVLVLPERGGAVQRN